MNQWWRRGITADDRESREIHWLGMSGMKPVLGRMSIRDFPLFVMLFVLRRPPSQPTADPSVAEMGRLAQANPFNLTTLQRSPCGLHRLGVWTFDFLLQSGFRAVGGGAFFILHAGSDRSQHLVFLD